MKVYFHKNQESGESSFWDHKFFLPLSLIGLVIWAISLSLLVLKLKDKNLLNTVKMNQIHPQ